jgi:hypothetical protein
LPIGANGLKHNCYWHTSPSRLLVIGNNKGETTFLRRATVRQLNNAAQLRGEKKRLFSSAVTA